MSARLMLWTGLVIALVGSILLGTIALQSPPFAIENPKTYAEIDAYYSHAYNTVRVRLITIFAATMFGFLLQVVGLVKLKLEAKTHA